MDIPEKLATLGTHDTKRRQTQQTNTTQHVLDTTMRKQTHTKKTCILTIPAHAPWNPAL
jgi:hypothetical protein